ncbi:MAG TPA: cytochrome c peroxidase [Gemmataceae bacterium]|nr:cytochrome c peroxidase [Gemmataceae bacterium]
MRIIIGVLLVGGLLLGGLNDLAGFGLCCMFVHGDTESPARAVAKEPAEPRLRQPAALALADDGSCLFVANRRSGSISTVNTVTLRTTAELAVGRSLVDLASSPRGQLLAVDEAARELIVLSRRGSAVHVVHRLPVPPIPVRVQITQEGDRCFVTSLWARQVSEIDLTTVPPHIVRTISLPFAPREELLIADGKLVVADAFGGQLAVLDIGRGKADSVRTLPAHNLRGLALSHDGKELWVTHQALNSRAGATFDDVHWGNLMTNNLRVLRLTEVLSPQADLLPASRVHYLGDVGNAAGDPAGVAVGRDGTVVVALAGVGDVALGKESEAPWRRVTVGRRPTAVVLSSDGRRAFVANQFGDSVSVLDLLNRTVTANVPLGSQPELSASDRGELLFYDARLSHDGWMSCHSCHTDGHTNGLLADTLGDGSLGTPKRVLSLLGARDTAPYAWNGSMANLESQIRKSIVTTLHGAQPSEQQVTDLAAYVRTLPPPTPLARRVDPASVQRGQEVFHNQSCNRCHTPPEYTSKGTYDVGLKDEAGNTRFNPPSLRGISQGGPYFHDNRAATLEEVFTRHRHQLTRELSRHELADLLAFLGSL